MQIPIVKGPLMIKLKKVPTPGIELTTPIIKLKTKTTQTAWNQWPLSAENVFEIKSLKGNIWYQFAS